MKVNSVVATLLVLLAALSGCTAVDLGTLTSEPINASASEEASLTVDSVFVTHIAAELAEQDVFVETGTDPPTQVVRVKGDEAADPAILASMVYASATAVEHDFMELGKDPFGPFLKGEPLGFTLEEWLAATGHGTYELFGDRATLSIEFQNLVPDGIYSAWCGRLGFAPTFAAVDMPCGAMDGSQNVFQADGEGNATFELTMHPLIASNDDIFADIAFAYHSDGQTHGKHPGDFGMNSHVQLFVLDPVPAPVAIEPNEAEVSFVTHVAFSMPEQDVFIESGDDATLAVRPLEEAEDVAVLGQMIYAAAEPIEHNPLEVGANPRGPFLKGEALGMTLAEWLAATGAGTYTIEGDQATLEVNFENLVPNGVYSAWCGIITIDEAFFAVDIPCGALDGSQARFEADADGNATYQVTMPALPASDDHTFSDIAFAYHSDGQTHGRHPGDFGKNSHVQLFIAEYPPAPHDLP